MAKPPPKLDTDWLLTIPAFKEFYDGDQEQVATGSSGPSIPEKGAATPEESIETAYHSLQSALKQELLDRVLQNSPAFFERVIVDLLSAMGYGGSQVDAASHLGKSGDGGVDGVINEDALGLDRVYVQAKRYASSVTVGRPDIQGFVGRLIGFGANKGVFVTTSSFSAQARDFVSKIPQRVVLIDGVRLCELMLAHSVGLRTGSIIEFKRLDEDYFAEE